MKFLELRGQQIPLDATRVSFALTPGLSVREASELGKLPRLTALNLNGVSIGDDVLEVIGRLHQLEDLDVSMTEITDAGAPHLRGLRSLKHLRIKENRLTDALVAVLLDLPLLETLNLKQLPLSDAAIERLAALEHLELVVFSGLHSRAGVEALKRLRPACDVIVDGKSIPVGV